MHDTYPGYCLTMSVIQVPLSLCSAAAVPNTCHTLIKVTHVIKERLQQKVYPSLIAIDRQQAKVMLTGIHTAVL